MQVEVIGRRVEVPEQLRNAAVRKVTQLDKYLTGMDHGEVIFTDGNGHRAPVGCEVKLEGKGHVVRASASGHDPALALDEAVGRASVQMARLKKRLVDRSRPRHGAAPD